MTASEELQKHLRAMERARAAGDAKAMIAIRQRIGAVQSRADDEAEVAGQGTAMRLFRGLGTGAENVGRNIAQMASRVPGLGALRPDDAGQQLFEQRRQALRDTTAGAVGDFAGEMAATMPVGGVAGKAAGAAFKGLSAVARPVGNMMAQAAAEGAVTAGEGHRMEGAAGGALAAGALGKATQALRRVARGVVQPTEAARYLRAQGVDNMTLAQMQPNSTWGQMEQVASTLPMSSGRVLPARQAAMDRWRDVTLREGLPPSMKKVPSAAEPAEQLRAMHKGFAPDYAVVDKEMVYPAIHGKGLPLQGRGTSKGAFDLAVTDPSRAIDPQSRKTAAAYLQNQLGILPNQPVKVGHGMHASTSYQRPPMLKEVPAGDLLQMRSNIRDEIRRLKMNPANEGTVYLLQNAEQATTAALESQLSPKAARHLKLTDTQYAKKMVLQKAATDAGDAGGRMGAFTPSRLSTAVKRTTEPGIYGRGGGAKLRNLARYGKATVEADMPKTGIRAAFLSSLPVAGGAITAAAGTAATTPSVVRFATGGTRKQLQAQALEKALRRRVKDSTLRTAGATVAANTAVDDEE